MVNMTKNRKLKLGKRSSNSNSYHVTNKNEYLSETHNNRMVPKLACHIVLKNIFFKVPLIHVYKNVYMTYIRNTCGPIPSNDTTKNA